MLDRLFEVVQPALGMYQIPASGHSTERILSYTYGASVDAPCPRCFGVSRFGMKVFAVFIFVGCIVTQDPAHIHAQAGMRW